MRHHALVLGLSAVVLGACAHAREEEARSPRESDAEPAPPPSSRDVVAIDTVAPAEARPPARPRLSQTITLGQGQTDQAYSPAAPRPQPPPQPPGQNVVVNNVVVQGAPGYYGYGGYYAAGGYGRPTTFYSNDGRSGGNRGVPQWGATGWEGARRTAAPGQTPGIGGNWAPPPSYGPAQMK